MAALALALQAPARADYIPPGDCNDDGVVAIDDFVTMIDVGSGNRTVDECAAGDFNGDGRISGDELRAVTRVLIEGDQCGSGFVNFDLGETCDDGNTVDDDGADATNPCPFNCRVAACRDSGGMTTADVRFTPPAGVDLASLQIFLRYPDGVVRIPGAGGDPAVGDRIFNAPDNAFTQPNDLDFALRLVAFSTDQLPFAPGVLFSVQFNTCQGAPAVTATDFGCIVESAGDVNSHSVSGTTCAVTLQ